MEAGPNKSVIPSAIIVFLNRTTFAKMKHF
jgi:hypothetical protein